jgi:hypothetical protein
VSFLCHHNRSKLAAGETQLTLTFRLRHSRQAELVICPLCAVIQYAEGFEGFNQSLRQGQKHVFQAKRLKSDVRRGWSGHLINPLHPFSTFTSADIAGLGFSAVTYGTPESTFHAPEMWLT